MARELLDDRLRSEPRQQPELGPSRTGNDVHGAGRALAADVSAGITRRPQIDASYFSFGGVELHGDFVARFAAGPRIPRRALRHDDTLRRITVCRGHELETRADRHMLDVCWRSPHVEEHLGVRRDIGHGEGRPAGHGLLRRFDFRLLRLDVDLLSQDRIGRSTRQKAWFQHPDDERPRANEEKQEHHEEAIGLRRPSARCVRRGGQGRLSRGRCGGELSIIGIRRITLPSRERRVLEHLRVRFRSDFRARCSGPAAASCLGRPAGHREQALDSIGVGRSGCGVEPGHRFEIARDRQVGSIFGHFEGRQQAVYVVVAFREHRFAGGELAGGQIVQAYRATERRRWFGARLRENLAGDVPPRRRRLLLIAEHDGRRGHRA